MLSRLADLPTRVVLLLFLLVSAGGMAAALASMEDAGRRIDEIETRWVREHALTIYMTQSDLMKARRAMAGASAEHPDAWLMRYEIAAARAETMRSFVTRVWDDAHPDELALADALEEWVARSDAVIAAAGRMQDAAAEVDLLAAEVEALLPGAVDQALRRTQELRRRLGEENDAVLRRMRLTAVVAFAAQLGFVLVLLVMHHRLRARNARLIEMRDQLARALEVRRRFLAGVSHDFRTPLNAISGFAQLLMHRDIDVSEEKRRRFLTLITESAGRLERMTTDLLDLARMERGAYDLREEDGVDLAELLRAVADRFGPAAAAQGVTLSAPERGRREPCPTLRADPAELERAVSNLIDNAVKFSPRGGAVRVTLDRRGVEALVAVQDEGPGIPPERLRRIWDLFGARDQSPEGARRGAGLGLAIARGVVEAHGGRIEVQSEPGQGARFTIHLPLRRKRPDPVRTGDDPAG